MKTKTKTKGNPRRWIPLLCATLAENGRWVSAPPSPQRGGGERPSLPLPPGVANPPATRAEDPSAPSPHVILAKGGALKDRRSPSPFCAITAGGWCEGRGTCSDHGRIHGIPHDLGPAPPR